LQLRVKVEVMIGPSWKPTEALANGNTAPGEPFGAGQEAVKYDRFLPL
jgi:hypothetical protein